MTDTYEKTFDTPEWRAERNSKMIAWIGQESAVNWVLDFFNIAEFFDDVYDKDKQISNKLIEQVVYSCLVDYPSNTFFQAYSYILTPQISFVIMLWIGANQLEHRAMQNQEDDDGAEILHDLHRAFTERNVYAMMIMTVIEIVRGREIARSLITEVMDFFGAETFEEYSVKMIHPNGGK